jgi:methionine biosynthesis protein MetW
VTREGDAMRRFEDRRWSNYTQEPVWRHTAALGLVRREPVLDVGGGDGLFLRMLAERGMTELAMADFSQVAVDRARESGIDAHLVDLDEGLPFSDGAFGTVCALDVLEHLTDPGRALAELARVGREVVIVVPNFSYWRDRLRVAVGRVPLQLRPARGHVHWFNRRVLDEILAESGLRVDAYLNAPAVRLGALGRFLASSAPNLFAHSFGVRAVRR